MEERIWPGSEAAAATGEAGEHFGKAVYLFFLNLPPQPLLPYYIFVGFFLCSLSEVLLGLAVCSSLLPIYLVWFPTYDLAAVCATEREKQCLIC